ncbi:hypothetical protein LCGC14_2603120 [marine sediment metagenome]|uniref:Uncharacterized protein n=1 Tax=marine sediment metagenome TaxID=412755 RepID=A0A0F9CJ71_9ZZZZ
MAKVKRSMRIPELNLDPPVKGEIRLSEDMQQTLALLTGYGDNKRVVLKATESGVLHVVSPQLKEIVVLTADATPYAWQGGDVPCTEVALIAGLDNAGRVWVRPNSAASAVNGWPLDKAEVFAFTISNLNQLHVTIQTSGEIAVLAYTR